jgi:hypothetical protein
MSMAKHNVAYVVVDVPGGGWGVGACKRGETGYHPVDDYGPYEDESRAQGIVDRLNARLGVSKTSAHTIVRSTMRNATARAREARP